MPERHYNAPAGTVDPRACEGLAPGGTLRLDGYFGHLTYQLTYSGAALVTARTDTGPTAGRCVVSSMGCEQMQALRDWLNDKLAECGCVLAAGRAGDCSPQEG